jgi:hypothetical protein
MVRIQDPQTGDGASVGSDGRLAVDINDLTDLLAAKAAVGEAFIAAGSYAATAADDVFYIANTDTEKLLVIDRIIFSSLAACGFLVSQPTGTAAAGALTAQPLKSSVAVTRSVELRGGAAVTGLTGGTEFLDVFTGAGGPAIVDLGLVLAENARIAVEATVTTTVAVTVVGHWE